VCPARSPRHPIRYPQSASGGQAWRGPSEPLASPPGQPDTVYGFGRIDASGRVAGRAAISVLGWRGGDRLTLIADAGVMVARRDPGGMVTVPARPCIMIPGALRRRCGLRSGDHVLLAASPGENKLTAYSFAAVDQAMRRTPRPFTTKGGSHDTTRVPAPRSQHLQSTAPGPG
jgi:hypothetical protein